MSENGFETGRSEEEMKLRFMGEALRQAEKALETDEVPVGAVIVHKNRIIAKAYNQTNLLKDPTAHAEILAITQAAEHFKHERLLETELYCTMEPCAMCYGAIVHARIPKLYYGCPNDKYGACGSVVDITRAPWNHAVRIERGLASDRCAALVQAFFRSKRG